MSIATKKRSNKICLLAGGNSLERQISLNSATNISNSLLELGIENIQLDTADSSWISSI